MVYIHRLHKFGTQKTYKAALWRLDTLICIDINKYFRLKPRIYHPVDGWRPLIRTRAELLNNKLLITMISKIFENFDPKWKYIFRHEFQCRWFCWVLEVTRNEKTSSIARTPFKDKSFVKGNTRYRKVKIDLRERLIELCQNVIVINYES